MENFNDSSIFGVNLYPKDTRKRKRSPSMEDHMRVSMLKRTPSIEKNFKELKNLKIENFLQGHRSRINSVAISTDNKFLISGSSDLSVRVWNLLENKQEAIFGADSEINCTKISNDSKYVVAGCRNGEIKVGNLSKMREKVTFDKKFREVFCLALTKKCHKIVSAGDDNFISVGSVKDYSFIRCYRGHGNNIMNIIISKDEKFFITCSEDKTIRMRNFKHNEELYVWKSDGAYFINIAASENNGYSLTLNDLNPNFIFVFFSITIFFKINY